MPFILSTMLTFFKFFDMSRAHSIMVSTTSLKLHTYSDMDWAGDPTDRCSITSLCFLLGTSFVLWHNKKQDVVSHSSIEAEYRALADTTYEFV